MGLNKLNHIYSTEPLTVESLLATNDIGILDNILLDGQLGTANQVITMNEQGTGIKWGDAVSGVSFTTSAELRDLISDETGTGSLVFNNAPTFTGTVNTAAIEMSGILDLNNYNITGVGNLEFSDPGVGEGLSWLGGNLWKIYESPDALTNAAGNLQFVQGSGNTIRMTLDTTGILYTQQAINIGDDTTSTETRYLQIGNGRTGSGFAYVDLIGDSTYTDYGLRLIRNNGGANTDSILAHRGTGILQLNVQDAGTISFATNGSVRQTISSNGDITFKSAVNTDVTNGTTSATSTFNTTVYSSAEFIVYCSTSTGNYVSKVMMLARGSATPIITEYAILTQGTAPAVTITPSYSAPNAVLTVAVTSGTNIEIVKTAVSI